MTSPQRSLHPASGMRRSNQHRTGPTTLRLKTRPRVNGSGYGAMHNPLRRGIGDGKNNIPPPVWRFENEGGLVSRNQLRLSRTKRKSAAAESQNKSGGVGAGRGLSRTKLVWKTATWESSSIALLLHIVMIVSGRLSVQFLSNLNPRNSAFTQFYALQTLLSHSRRRRAAHHLRHVQGSRSRHAPRRHRCSNAYGASVDEHCQPCARNG